MSKTETILSTIEHLDFEHAIMCESGHCEHLGRGSHEADWFVKFSCGCSMAWCNFRFLHYTKYDAPEAGLNCPEHGLRHSVTVVSWVPIRM